MIRMGKEPADPGELSPEPRPSEPQPSEQQPAEQQPAEQQPAEQQPAAELSMLEKALRQALANVPREQVVKCIVSVLPATVFVDQSARLHGGKVRKVSVSMPEELAEAVRTRTGSGGFSRYVTDLLDRELKHELLGELIDEFEARNGPISEELLEEAAREWPDHG
jgi:hypothetical protein